MADWAALGACRQPHDYRANFFPERINSPGIDEARAVCRGCPVRALCLDEALQDEEIVGVWGGTLDHERVKIRQWMIVYGAKNIQELREKSGQAFGQTS